MQIRHGLMRVNEELSGGGQHCDTAWQMRGKCASANYRNGAPLTRNKRMPLAPEHNAPLPDLCGHTRLD